MNLNEECLLSLNNIEALLKSKQNFLDGKTTAKNWEDIEAELSKKYSQISDCQELKIL
jgi:hypothetical protein